MSRKFVALAVVAIIALVAAGYSPLQAAPKQASPKQAQKPLVLTSFGPKEIKAGTVFNKQSNGESAIWTETENATSTTVLVLNGVSLKSAPQQDGTVVTAVVPKKLYEKAGEYPLYLLDKKTKQKSNELKFVVKP